MYEALDLETDKTVAVKLLRQKCLQTEQEMSQLIKEVEIISQLSHKNIIKIY